MFHFVSHTRLFDIRGNNSVELSPGFAAEERRAPEQKGVHTRDSQVVDTEQLWQTIRCATSHLEPERYIFQFGHLVYIHFQLSGTLR